MLRRGLLQRSAVSIAGLLLGAGMEAAMALQPSRGIVVLYPDIGEPYRSVFGKMIQGIQERTRGQATSIAIGNSANAQDIAGELRRQDTQVVIALGRNGVKMAATLGRDLGVVVGGVVGLPEAEAGNFTVSSLTPDPALLFARLKSFAPAARRVFVVYDPAQNAWLIRLAKTAAAARGLELAAFEASELKAALQHYQTIITTMESGRDALWLPLDSTTVQEAAVLPLVLQEAWQRNLLVFSSNVAHVRRGALFALFPDNVEVGRTLADQALGYLAPAGAPPRGLTPLRAVLLAVNVRTAAHLGIDLAGRQQGIDLVFPEP